MALVHEQEDTTMQLQDLTYWQLCRVYIRIHNEILGPSRCGWDWHTAHYMFPGKTALLKSLLYEIRIREQAYSAMFRTHPGSAKQLLDCGREEVKLAPPPAPKRRAVAPTWEEITLA